MRRKFDSKEDKHIEIDLYESEIDILIQALEVYMLNFRHFRCMEKDRDLQEYLNFLVFNLYHRLRYKQSYMDEMLRSDKTFFVENHVVRWYKYKEAEKKKRRRKK